MADDDAERTEQPTARRLEQARADGDVAVSREFSGVVGLAAGLGALSFIWADGGAQLARTLRNLVEQSGRMVAAGVDWNAITGAIEREASRALLPVLLAPLVGMTAASLLQSGFVLRLKGLAPDLQRISPMRGFARLVSPHNLVETGKSLVKLVVSSFVVWRILSSGLPVLAVSDAVSTGRMTGLMVRLAFEVAIGLMAVQLVVAGLDVAWLRYSRMKKLRMTRQELRDEHKESDGNPQVKSRLRALRRQRARQRMMLAVPTATVVLTNPTHYAVALVYEQGSRSAPRIVAKGADEVASRIRTLARDHRVPLVANPPLARALFKVPLEEEVPRELFQAVAAVIAYVWRLNQRQAQPVG